MKCQSYLPLYYTRNDLNADSNRSTRPVYTGHVSPPTGHFSQMFMNSHVTDGYRLSYDKEFLRQTILQQEVTFKDQVQELHRLYRRQRELLDEIKRNNNFYKNNVLSEAQWPLNSLTSNVSFSYDQKAARGIAFDSLAFSQPSSHVSENVRSSSVLDLSLSCTNIARRKPLDLQLPADEYINNEGKESSNNFEISGLSIWSTHASNRVCPLPAVGTLSDFPEKKKLKMCKDFTEAGDGKSRSSLNSSGWYSYSESLQRLAEPGQAHQTAPLFTKKDDRLEIGSRKTTDAKLMGSIHGMLNLYTPGQVGGASHTPVLEFPAAHSSKVKFAVRENFISQAVPCLSPDFPAIKIREPCVDELDNSFRLNANVKASSASSSFLFQNYKCDLGTAENETAKHTNRLGSIDLNCTAVGVSDGFAAITDVSREKVDDLTSPDLVILDPSGSCEETALLGSTNVGHSGTSMLFDMNLPCHVTADTVSLEDDPLVDDQNHLDLINLDSNLKDDQISPSSASSMQVAEVDLEAPMIPVSPEKRESRRPRGESEENKTELSFPLSTIEDGESVDGDLMKIAVDVLVSISSPEPPQNSTVSEQSSDELLIWFAEIVCSKEHGDGLTASNTTEIDYFEAMTLKLTETSEEDYWPKTTTLLNEKETSDSPFSGESSKGGRTTKRVKRKNFQREVLPSLASLSRYEVSEDIQIIEMLMETNGTPLQMGVKARKLGKKRRVKGRKKMCITDTATSTAWESRICLLALPQMGIKAVDLKEKGGVRWWENTPRQPRGKRRRPGFPNSTPSLSQEGWMRKWGGIGFLQKGIKKLKQVEMLAPQVGSS